MKPHKCILSTKGETKCGYKKFVLLSVNAFFQKMKECLQLLHFGATGCALHTFALYRVTHICLMYIQSYFHLKTADGFVLMMDHIPLAGKILHTKKNIDYLLRRCGCKKGCTTSRCRCRC